MLTDSFKAIISKRQQFIKNCLVGIINPDKDKAVKYLALMNELVDYYLLKQTEGSEPQFTIVYLPKCPEWAEDIFFEFLTIKLAFSNASTATEIRKIANNISYNQTGKAYKKEKEHRRFLKELCDSIEKDQDYLESQYGCLGKSLIFYQKNRLDAYKRKQKFYADFLDNFPSKSVSVTSNEIKEIKKEATKKRNLGLCCNLDNIIIFNSQNKNSKTYTKPEIEKLNQLNVGVKNVIVFDFSGKPFVLNNLFEKRNLLSNRYPQQKGNETEFVSFSKKELNYLFDYEEQCSRFECGNENQFLMFEANVKDVVDGMEYPIKARNDLAICFDESLMYSLISKYNEYADVEDFEIFSQCLKNDWESIRREIELFREKNDLAVVFIDVDDGYAKEFQNFIRLKLGCDVTLYSMYDLKKGIVKQKRILIFQYRSHNANTFFARWPNSFDDFKINTDQRILQIIQKSIFADKYEWDLHDYNNLLNKILSSSIRNACFADSREVVLRPSYRKVNLQEDDDDIDGNSMQNHFYQVYGEQKWSKKMYGTDYLLLCDTHEDGGEGMMIQQVRAVYEKGKEVYLWYEARPIDELVKFLDNIANEKASKESEQENEYKKKYQNKYNINDAEDIELWRRILKKKIESGGCNAYDEIQKIVRNYNPLDKFVSEKRFLDWINPKIDMILPRQKRHQQAVWEFLGMQSVYLNYVRHRMHRKKSNSKERNKVLTDFIVKYYYSQQEDDYEDYLANDEFTAYSPLDKAEFKELIVALHEECCNEDKWACLEIEKC